MSRTRLSASRAASAGHPLPISDGTTPAADAAALRDTWSRRNALRFRFWFALAALCASALALAPVAAVAQVQGVNISPTALTISENGGTGIYTIVLTAAPATNQTVTINLSRLDPTLLTATTNSVTFNSDNWSNPKGVRVTAVDDGENDPQSQTTVTIEHSIETNTGTYGGSPADVVVTIENDTDPPAQVTGLALTERIGEVAASWNQAANADGYKVQWVWGTLPWGDPDREHTIINVATTTYTIPNLAPREYTVRVFSTRESQESRPSTEAKARALQAAPGKATGVTVTSEVGRLSVSWTAATNADGYKVQWKSGAQSYDPATRQAAVDSGTSHVINGLDPGVYTVRVIATRQNAEDGEASDEVTGTAKAPQPGKVTGVTVTAEHGVFEVGWIEVNDADGYKVQWKSGNEEYDPATRQKTTGTILPTVLIDGLTPGIEHTVRVIATREFADDGDPSDEVTGTPLGDPGVIITPTELTVSENGGTATYTVMLAASPSPGGSVTITWSTSGDTAAVTVEPPTLAVFTPDNWNDPQTVTVTGVDNDVEDPNGRRTTMVDHALQSVGNYGDNISVPSVTVTVEDDEAPPPPPVEEDDDTPPPPPAATPLAVTLVLTPSSIAEDGGAATVTATLDRAATAEVTLTVSAAPVAPAAAGDFTLSANRVLTFAAGSRTSTGRVTLTAVDNDVFAPDKTLTVSAAATGGVQGPASVVLTIAEDEDPPTATLHLEPSTIDEDGGTATVTATLDGAAAEDVTVTVSAAPVAPAAAGDFTLSANRVLTIAAGSTTSTGEVTLTAADNNLYAPDDKTVTVSAAATGSGVQDPDPVTLTIVEDDEKGLDERDAEMVLAGMARGLASGAVNVLGGRFDASPAGGARMTLAGHRLGVAEGQAAGGTQPAWYGTTGTDPQGWPGASLDGEPGPGAAGTALSERDLLLRSSFELPLNASGTAGAPSWTLWGRGAASGFSGSSEPGLDLDGTFYSGYLGMDYRPRPNVLLGLALSHSKGTVDYERTGEGAAKAEIDVKLNSVLPYVHWEPQSGLGVWTLVGAGSGDMKVTTEGGATVTTDLSSYLGAAGVRRELATLKGVDLALKADAFTATLRSKGNADEDIPTVRGNAVRVRAALEGSLDWETGPDSRLTPSLELGGRWDDGTSERGLGAELGGGLAYTHAGLGLSVEADARYLLVHRVSSLDEWGASLKVKLDPGASGRGASLTVAPVWGPAPGGTDGLWDSAGVLDQLGSRSGDPGWTPQRLDVALAYGLPLSRDRGMVTPYSGVTLGGSDSVRYRVGSRLTFGPSLNLTLEGDRTEQAGKPPSHGLSAQFGVRW